MSQVDKQELRIAVAAVVVIVVLLVRGQFLFFLMCTYCLDSCQTLPTMAPRRNAMATILDCWWAEHIRPEASADYTLSGFVSSDFHWLCFG